MIVSKRHFWSEQLLTDCTLCTVNTLAIDQEQLNRGTPPVPGDCDHESCEGHCWKGYPQSRFPNWTPGQVIKCKIRAAIDDYDRSLDRRAHV